MDLSHFAVHFITFMLYAHAQRHTMQLLHIVLYLLPHLHACLHACCQHLASCYLLMHCTVLLLRTLQTTVVGMIRASCLLSGLLGFSTHYAVYTHEHSNGFFHMCVVDAHSTPVQSTGVSDNFLHVSCCAPRTSIQPCNISLAVASVPAPAVCTRLSRCFLPPSGPSVRH
jgi:hypothetical protein